MEIYDHIRRLRLHRGYSQEDMADAMNMTSAGYGKIENGRTKLTVERLFEISELLEVNPITLLEVSVEKEPRHYPEEYTEYSTVEEPDCRGLRRQLDLLEKIIAEKERLIRLYEQQLDVKKL